MRKIFVAATYVFLLVHIRAEAQVIEAKIELKQTGESARVHDPDCSTGETLTAADLIIKAGVNEIDKYTGYPVASTLWEKTPAGNRDWVKARLGIHNGKATCAGLCINTPKAKHYLLQACFSETGGDKLGCTTTPTDQLDPGWVAVSTLTTAPTKSGLLVCATGKNWSHNRDRWFYLRATPN